jgi:mitogen-activated protein kinase kinase kinase
MAAATMSTNQPQLDNLPQPSSQPNSPSSLYTAFNQPARLFSARSHSSLPGTPTSATHTTTILDIPPGMNYPDFLRTWSDSHISTWLTNIKCGHHAPTFRTSDIRGDVILELDQITLKEIGIASVGDRLRILNAVKTLRQRCSNRTERTPTTYASFPPRVVISPNDDPGHRRTASATSPTSRLPPRRQEHTRPPPLQLGSSANPQPNLPHIIRDSASSSDSLRSNHIRPLPHPIPTATSSSSSTPVTTPGTSQSTSSRGPHLPLPPVPRTFPPPPPAALSAPSAGRSANRPFHGRRTPTQLDAPEFTSQPLPPAPILPPHSAATWSGYGLPPDPKAGFSAARSPKRSQSPLPNVPRTSTRSPVSHGRNLSSGGQGSLTPPKPTQRPSGSSHPYAQGLQPSVQAINVLSPIAESFSSQPTPIRPTAPSASPPPSTPYSVGRGPFANASSSSTPPSLVDLRRKLVKFMLGDEGHSTTINVEDCVGGVEVLEKALKNFGRLNARNSELEGLDRVGTSEGGLSVDGWCVFLDWGNESSPGAFLFHPTCLRLFILYRSPSYRGTTTFSMSRTSE